MEGIILAGGTGSRLFPVTKVINKHILPLYDKPMIFYSVALLMQIDIRKINIVCNIEDLENYKKLLGDGSALGIRICYVIQEKSRGLIDGISQCRNYIESNNIVLLLGDNFFYGLEFDKILEEEIKRNIGATMFGIHRNHSHTITTINFENDNISLIRKTDPEDEIISPGIFIYNKDVFAIVDEIKRKRPEAEWVEVNNEYKKRNRLSIRILGNGLVWYDVGIWNSRLKAEIFVSQIQEDGQYVGYIEEIAYEKKWITRETLVRIIKEMEECSYKRHLQEKFSKNKC